MMIDKKIALLAVGGALLGGCSMVDEGPGTDGGVGSDTQASAFRPSLEPSTGAVSTDAADYRTFEGWNKCFGDWAQNDWPRDMNQTWEHGGPDGPVQTNPNYGISLAFLQGKRKDGSDVLAQRSDPSHAAGGPNGSSAGGFTSLGFGGSYIARMPNLVRDLPGADIRLHEVTSNYTCDQYREEAEVHVSYDGIVWAKLAGTACNGDNTEFDLATMADDAPWQLQHFGARFVRVVDVTQPGTLPNDADGYDLDAIEAIHCGGNERTIDLCAEGFYGFYEQEQGNDTNGNPVAAARSDAANGLGIPEDVETAAEEPAGGLSFYAMGIGGSIVYVLDGWVDTTSILEFVETS